MRLTKTVVQAQRRRCELDSDERTKRRKILRRKTGKHLLTYQLLAAARRVRQGTESNYKLDNDI